MFFLEKLFSRSMWFSQLCFIIIINFTLFLLLLLVLMPLIFVYWFDQDLLVLGDFWVSWIVTGTLSVNGIDFRNFFSIWKSNLCYSSFKWHMPQCTGSSLRRRQCGNEEFTFVTSVVCYFCSFLFCDNWLESIWDLILILTLNSESHLKTSNLICLTVI